MVSRFEIVKVFSDPQYLFFEHGVIWNGDEMNGTCVLYRLNGRAKEIVTNKKGELEGLRATYHPSGAPRSLRHYKKGKLYGEAQDFDRSSVCISHRLFTGNGEESVQYRKALASDYQGHLVCKEDLDAESMYRSIGPRGWTE